MEPDNHRKSSTLTDREKVKFKNELFIYLFFLLISIGFWYLIALGKEQRAVISFPVQYENWPTGKALVSDLPQELEISVRGVGYSILRHKLTAYFRPISLSVRNFVFDSIWHQNHFEYLTYTRDLRETLLNHMNNEVQVIDIMPDTLRFVFAKVVEKMVPIRSVLNLQYENQYQLYGRIVSDPESIVVSGPGLLVDTLKCVYTKSFEQKNIKDSIISEVELTPYKKISFQRNKVWLIIPVQKFTELELNIPIETENITDGIVVKTFPGYVTLTCKVAVSEYSKISPYMFRATIDYQSIMSSGQKKARVSLAKFPLNVENIKFYPRNVEYLIEKMIKVGITGGIGSGKTTVCLIFEKLGIPVYYADERAKVLMNNSKSIRALLIDHFGNSIYNTSVLNREKLASIIFNDKKALEVVNSIVHPAVANDFELWSNSHSRLPYVMEEAALLFESSGYMQMDLMITVSAPEEVRIYRVVKRDMTTSEQVRKRMDSQWPEEEKICRSQFVIQNDEKHSLVSQINTIHHTILSKQ